MVLLGGSTYTHRHTATHTDFRKGYKRPDGCPVPDWFVDEHRKPVEKWQTKRERGFAGGGGGKRHKPFGSGSHGNKR